MHLQTHSHLLEVITVMCIHVMCVVCECGYVVVCGGGVRVRMYIRMSGVGCGVMWCGLGVFKVLCTQLCSVQNKCPPSSALTVAPQPDPVMTWHTSSPPPPAISISSLMHVHTKLFHTSPCQPAPPPCYGWIAGASKCYMCCVLPAAYLLHTTWCWCWWFLTASKL